MTEDRIEQLLKLKVVPEEEKMQLPKEIKVTTYAIRKAHGICKIIEKMHGPNEWYGLLISKKDNLELAVDILLGEQECCHSHTRVDGEEIAKVVSHLKEYMPDYTISGWIHSHASMGTFFSHGENMDTGNIETVLNSVSLNTQKRFMQNYRLIEGGLSLKKDGSFVVLSGDLKTDPEVHFGLPLDLSSLSKESIENAIKIKQPVLVGWSYNIVINNSGQKYGEIAVCEEYPLQSKTKKYRETAGITIVEDSRSLDLKILQKEVRKKINVSISRHPPLGFGGWYERIFGNGKSTEQVSLPKKRIFPETNYGRDAGVSDTEAEDFIRTIKRSYPDFDEIYKKKLGIMLSAIPKKNDYGHLYILSQKCIEDVIKHSKKNKTFADFVKNFTRYCGIKSRMAAIDNYTLHLKNDSSNQVR